MPSAWIEKRKNKNRVTHLVRWSFKVGTKRVLGCENCGPSRPYANKRMGEVLDDLYAGRTPQPKLQSMTMPIFVNEYLENSKKTKALATYANFDKPAVEHFARWHGNKPLTMIVPKTLYGWRDQLFKDGFEPNTVRMRLRALSAALSYAVTPGGYLERNPFELCRAKGRQQSTLFPKAVEPARYLSPGEVELLLRKLPRRAAEAVYFILQTGLRHDELLGLDWKMVHRQKSGPWTMEITSASAHGIEGGHQTKTRKARDVEIPANAVAVMGAPKDSGPVFAGKTRSALGLALRRATEALDMGTVRVHDFRHTWATNFMYKTGNQFELLYRGGWSSVVSAAGYQHLRRRGEPVEYPPFPHYFRTNAKRPAPPRKG